MAKKVIQTDNAPAAIGPYSQATVHNGTMFISGQLPIDPATSTMIDGDIKEKTRQIIYNIRSICTEVGADLDSVIKTTIFLTDLADFAAVNEAYGEFFSTNPPARSTVQVAALPLGSVVEIESIVALD